LIQEVVISFTEIERLSQSSPKFGRGPGTDPVYGERNGGFTLKFMMVDFKIFANKGWGPLARTVAYVEMFRQFC
jgi:hypothetical protein